MLKALIKSSHHRALQFSKGFLKQIINYSEHPIFYLKEILNILKTQFFLYCTKNHNKTMISRYINKVNFQFDFNLDPQVLMMFYGFYEIKVRNALIRYLKKGDIFIDIGANIGYISATGASLVGKRGQVHSFEPVPYYYRRLQNMANLNKNFNIVVNNCALGDIPGYSEINITNLQNLGWNTMVPDAMSTETIKESVKIEVQRLDDYLNRNDISKISLIKIDVEGFELPVLSGFVKFLEQNQNSKPILIVEVAPGAYPKLGKKLEDLDDLMKKYSYNSFSIDGKKKVDIKSIKKTCDVLFI